MKVSALVIDSGHFPCVQLDNYTSLIASAIEVTGDVIDGIRLGLRTAPSFDKALFIVDGEYFVAELKPVYVDKDGKSSRAPIVGGFRIFELHIKAIEDRDAVGWATLHLTMQLKSLAKVFKETTSRIHEAVSVIESLGVNFDRAED